MIKRANRLRGSRAVGKILQKGFSFRTEHLTIRGLLAKPGDPVKLTVVVSKKISPRAVVRNKLKRKVREAFSEAIRGKSGLGIVVFPAKGVLDLSYNKLLSEAKQCLEKAPSS